MIKRLMINMTIPPTILNNISISSNDNLFNIINIYVAIMLLKEVKLVKERTFFNVSSI